MLVLMLLAIFPERDGGQSHLSIMEGRSLRVEEEQETCLGAAAAGWGGTHTSTDSSHTQRQPAGSVPALPRSRRSFLSTLPP